MKNKKIKATPEIIGYLKDTMEELKYGRIIIDIQDHLNTLDITVEQKQRFDKQERNP